MQQRPVDKGVPMPEKAPRKTHDTYFPWLKLEVGDSFHTGKRKTPIHPTVNINNKKHTDREFKAMREGDGYRVWRIR